jgi:AcrR family transcriptional regulator
MAVKPIVPSREQLDRALGGRWSDADLSRAIDLLSKNDGRFPAGVRTLPSGLVSAVQRERLLAAMLVGVNELGYRDLTVQDILSRAGASRPTFYENFEDKEACFLALLETLAQRFQEHARAAVAGGEGNWRLRLRRGLAALLQLASHEPDAARALLVEARASSVAARRRRDELLDAFAGCIEDQVKEDLGKSPSPITATGVVGGIESVLYTRLQRGETADLEALLPALMFFAVLPYEGREAASEELAKPGSKGES